ncbi:hypothetical protein B0H17DRAFT_1214382 [Mycena rosella]|uniref:F-box domain-containing protein n=1 Tax=Mycena rosella TaxID=1033263 RepID=A0AAD7CN65_MYCRO|nr:hypothetical protein B0H17DRAFT_1214382 [Mycena rosella]
MNAHVSLEVLLDNTVSAFSGREARLALTVRIVDIALKEIERVQTTIKAANQCPVKQALKLFRSCSTTKLNAQLELRKDENAAVVALAHEVSSGRRSLHSLQRFELSLLQRALRTRRNSLALIFRLPTEVLAPILEQCPTIEGDAPRFQTGNFVSGLKHRSRGAPLVVGVDMAASATKTVATRDLVLAQLGRIHELHVDIPASRSLPSSLLAPAPILDTFCLRYDMAVGEPAVPGLFQGQAAALRHLSLRCCTLDWASSLWDNLVSLELLDTGVNNDETGQFLPLVLARMRHLRTLKLTGTVPEPMDDVEPILLNLEMLIIHAYSWACAGFLRAVLLPKCDIAVRLPCTDTDVRLAWDVTTFEVSSKSRQCSPAQARDGKLYVSDCDSELEGHE